VLHFIFYTSLVFGTLGKSQIGGEVCQENYNFIKDLKNQRSSIIHNIKKLNSLAKTNECLSHTLDFYNKRSENIFEGNKKDLSNIVALIHDGKFILHHLNDEN